jgi:proline iminopeptidase
MVDVILPGTRESAKELWPSFLATEPRPGCLEPSDRQVCSTMGDLFPEIEPFERGMLDVGDGNLVYWEQSGNPDGKPIVLLHGGPGSGWNDGIRRTFDPRAYRIILFDQRNCGRSTPHAGDLQIDLAANTTEHLLADIELLRRHLRIDRWMLFGGSWGATLGLAYAERHPELVTGIILVAVTTTRQSEIDWLYHGAGRFFPAEWERFRQGVPAAERDGDLVSAYHRLLMDSDPAIHHQAARDWFDWEWSLVSVDPDTKPNPRYLEPRYQLAFARIVTHYFGNLAWLEDGILLRNAGRLHGIPGILIHGRFDMGGPPTTAWELAQAWPDAKLMILSGAGHSARDPGMHEAILAATNEFSGLTHSLAAGKPSS